MNTALAGLKVIDLTSALNGPFGTMILADYGADVIKVEPPHGDQCRTWGPLDAKSDESVFFAQVNRNKKSITLNLKSDTARELLYDLVKDADIVVENYKGGVTKKLKIDYETLHKINPRLIYGSSSGFGQTGPMSHRPCYDTVAQAMGGMLNITGFEENEPVKAGSAVADHVAGLYLSIGILLALQHREKTGQGQHVDISMVDTIFSLLENNIPNVVAGKAEPARMGNIDTTIAPFDLYPSKDGYVTLGVGNNTMWVRLCEAIGKPELADDPRYATNVSRFENYLPELKNTLSDWCQNYTKAEIEALMDEYSVPCGPVLTVSEAMEHPHIKAREMVVSCNHPVIGEMKMQGCVVKMSETPATVFTPAPALGENTCEILGLTPEQVEAYKAEGIM